MEVWPVFTEAYVSLSKRGSGKLVAAVEILTDSRCTSKYSFFVLFKDSWNEVVLLQYAKNVFFLCCCFFFFFLQSEGLGFLLEVYDQSQRLARGCWIADFRVWD